MNNNLPCFKCKHSTSERKDEAFCDLYEEWGSVKRAFTCENFSLSLHIDKDKRINGLLIRNNQTDDYRTEKQWNKAGFKVKDGENGTKMYSSIKASKFSKDNYSIYYLPEQVERI